MDLYENFGDSKKEKTVKKPEVLSSENVSREHENIIVTTLGSVANRDIDHELEIVTAEYIFGMDCLKDLFDESGEGGGSTHKVLRWVRKHTLDDLRKEALILGADAVVGVKIDYKELSAIGQSGPLMMVVTSGTAVVLSTETVSRSKKTFAGIREKTRFKEEKTQKRKGKIYKNINGKFYNSIDEIRIDIDSLNKERKELEDLAMAYDFNSSDAEESDYKYREIKKTIMTDIGKICREVDILNKELSAILKSIE